MCARVCSRTEVRVMCVRTQGCAYVCTRVCTRIFARLSAYVCAHVCARVFAHMCVRLCCACMRADLRVFAHLCFCVLLFVYIVLVVLFTRVRGSTRIVCVLYICCMYMFVVY